MFHFFGIGFSRRSSFIGCRIIRMRREGSWPWSNLKWSGPGWRSGCRGPLGLLFPMLLEVLRPGGIDQHLRGLYCYRSLNNLPMWCVAKDHCEGLRHWIYSLISLVMEDLWCSIIWGTRDRNSCVHQVSVIGEICLTRFGGIALILVWCSVTSLRRSGLWVLPLIPGMCQGGTHWWFVSKPLLISAVVGDSTKVVRGY